MGVPNCAIILLHSTAVTKCDSILKLGSLAEQKAAISTHSLSPTEIWLVCKKDNTTAAPE